MIGYLWTFGAIRWVLFFGVQWTIQTPSLGGIGMSEDDKKPRFLVLNLELVLSFRHFPSLFM